ncbi:hypothetical protein [Fictibacillus barbaricus]|jgi:hypothetical protein|uniref:Uncharacterized protein n=1 Tax=Fictibacillus barbaricus TaxID=182136 RepID=A0ABS2ZCD7_9BACL|nr:hypothetical protein [Fictibacillus barbaricus]MBN3544963.1 hypothetical protein [Fictibacillus barbaricus]GGB62746.1 hypothetical protein GCM10007199_30900 [Fictibacillus barbaricus]
MEQHKEYSAADLPAELVNELQSFEQKLSGQSNKNLVVIAYEKDSENTGR